MPVSLLSRSIRPHAVHVSVFILALTVSTGYAQQPPSAERSQPAVQTIQKTLPPESPTIPPPSTGNETDNPSNTPTGTPSQLSPPAPRGDSGATPSPTQAQKALQDEVKSEPTKAVKVDPAAQSAEKNAPDVTGADKKSKKDNTETTPPANLTSPHDIIVPAENSSPTAVPDAPTAPQLPAEKAAEMAKQAIPRAEARREAAELLTRLGVFKDGMTNREKPLTRAEWAGILVRALKHNTEMYELFPFYRDVPRMHPDYVAIEVARGKKLIQYSDNQGFYYPDRAITFSEAYSAISNALTGPLPGLDEQNALLKPFGGRAVIGARMSPAVAKLTRLRFFVTGTGQLDTELRLYEQPTPNEAAPFVASLMHIIELRGAAVNTDEENIAAVLPENLTLSLSPNTAVVEEQLVPGQRLFFSVMQPVSPLPRQSRARAVVRDVAKDQRRYVLLIDEIKTPEGVYYRTQAELVIQFQQRRRNNFIVPGQLFETVTQQLPIPQHASGATTPDPSSAAPGQSQSKSTSQKPSGLPDTPPAGSPTPQKSSPMSKIPLTTDKK